METCATFQHCSWWQRNFLIMQLLQDACTIFKSLEQGRLPSEWFDQQGGSQK